jgi:hypothetical protein
MKVLITTPQPCGLPALLCLVLELRSVSSQSCGSVASVRLLITSLVTSCDLLLTPWLPHCVFFLCPITHFIFRPRKYFRSLTCLPCGEICPLTLVGVLPITFLMLPLLIKFTSILVRFVTAPIIFEHNLI